VTLVSTLSRVPADLVWLSKTTRSAARRIFPSTDISGKRMRGRDMAGNGKRGCDRANPVRPRWERAPVSRLAPVLQQMNRLCGSILQFHIVQNPANAVNNALPVGIMQRALARTDGGN
jgi:hypothetical protein